MGKKQSLNPFFCSADDWQNNACLNWGSDPLEFYAIGYKEAADALVQHVIDTNRYQDVLVYPICFLYRQYLELRLKEIIREGNALLDENASFPTHHRLHELWPLVKGIVRRVWKTKKPSGFEFIEHAVTEFSKLDPESFSFRYPTDKEGRKVLLEIKHINIRHLSEQLAQVAEILDGFSSGISIYRDFKNEMDSYC